MIKTNLFSIFISILLGLNLVTPVYAETPSSSPTIHKEMREEMKETRTTNRCNVVTTRINNEISRLNNSDTIRENRHQKVIDSLNNLITKLKGQNIDTTKLQSDVATLQTKKSAWDTEYQKLLTMLNNTKQYGCGTSDGQFKQSVTDAKNQWMVMHTKNMDFWNFVQTTVRPDLQAVRAQIKATASPSPAAT